MLNLFFKFRFILVLACLKNYKRHDAKFCSVKCFERVHVLQMSPVHVLQMSPVHVLQMSPVHILQMSPVHWAIQLLEERLAMKKWSRKHGGFRPLLTPHGTFGYRYLPLTNRDAMLLTKSFVPRFLQKKLWLSCFQNKIFMKNSIFSLVDGGTRKNNEKMFLLTGKSCETFKFFVVLPG